MSFERAIDTQRDALLRLVARLMLVLVVLSDGRFESALSRWLCRTLSSVLARAEAAAGYLVIASSRMLVSRGFVTPDIRCGTGRAKLSAVPRYADPANGSDTCEGLLTRLRVLKALLDRLPRHARRLLRREAARGYAGTLLEFAMRAGRGAVLRVLAGECRPSRIERPPDKQFAPA